jgi:endonuclease G, mitochondrial
MNTINEQEWKVIRKAANDYTLYASQIEQVKAEIELIKKGHKKVSEVSYIKGHLDARLEQEREHIHASYKTAEVYERVIGKPDFQDASILQRLVNYSRAVCKVVLRGDGTATGWLIGENLLITNHHVLPNIEVAEGAIAKFDYERDVDGYPNEGESFRLRPDIFYMTPRQTSGIEDIDFSDFTVVAVEPVSRSGKKLADYGFVALDQRLGKILQTENCVVIQHPAGDYKKVVLRDIRLLAIENIPGKDHHIIYESDTLRGSSGSMVVALGTGKVIALHSAGVARMDANDNFLKKDGSVWKEGEPDDSIDWIANRGVRISKIVEAIRSLALPPNMEAIRANLMKTMNVNKSPVMLEEKNISLVNTTPVYIPEIEGTSTIKAHRFLVKVSGLDLIRENVLELINRSFGTYKIHKPLSFEENSLLDRYIDIEISSDFEPWELARKIELIDGVEEAEPDVIRFTTVRDIDISDEGKPALLEGNRGRRGNDLEGWINSVYLQGLNRSLPEDIAKIRRWNHKAVNFDVVKVLESLGKKGVEELEALKIVQFDTGYTRHSKVINSLNLRADYDAIDDSPDDAEDTRAPGFTHFEHGTRTGSIVIGAVSSDVPTHREGNFGLLRALNPDDPTLFLLTPYRISRSVVLIGRIRHLIDACTRALSAGYQVMTMSMGILPGSSALYDLVREVYERGVIWCCAAGNEVNFVVAPAKYPGTIAVAASNPNDEPWSGSCRGRSVDITAPGEDIYVPTTNGVEEDMNYGNGTSYAVPHVASAAMLWLAKNKAEIDRRYSRPWQRVEAFRYCLQVSARKVNTLPTNLFGAGILDIEALLATPLPKASDLQYAYRNAPELEVSKTKRPIALREAEYTDCYSLMQKDLRKAHTKNLNYLESNIGKVYRSNESLNFIEQINKKVLNYDKINPREFAANSIDSQEAIKARLNWLYEHEGYLKPTYFTNVSLPANSVATDFEASLEVLPDLDEIVYNN